MNNGSGVPAVTQPQRAAGSSCVELVPGATRSSGSIWPIRKQMVVVTDHDSKVLARRRSGARPGNWARPGLGCRARAPLAGYAGVTVACEPTGHRGG